VLAVVLLGAPLAAESQQAGKPVRLGFLSLHLSAGDPSPLRDAFIGGLREAGWIAGRNVTIEYRHAAGDPARLSKLAQDLVALKVDVIVAAGTQAIQAASRATTAIPIVMAISSDPVGSGLVASLARPGANVTGLTHLNIDISGKRLELLREAVPGARRVAVLWNSGHPVKPREWRAVTEAAQRLGMNLRSVEVKRSPDLDRVLVPIGEEKIDVLLVLEDPLLLAHRRRIAEFALRHRLPSMFEPREFVEAGGLMSYGPVFADLYRRAAVYVDKILKGTKPADLPVEQPTKFELVINMKTAKALGVEISPTVLAHVDEVIE
jgi:putative ABC transport system substrate-binding protein